MKPKLFSASIRARTADFPGYQAGASLKPEAVGGRGRRSLLLPRLPSRGLIEARFTSTTGPERTSLPRLPSRGLIEAWGDAVGKLCGWRHFPGYQAGASLKRGRPKRPYASLEGLPRLPSRGLIEAIRGRGDAPAANRNFPGYQAGASLKQRRRRCYGRRSQRLPRLPSRGLIEALPFLYSRDFHASLPRLPSRGLIEARAPSPTRGCATATSPVTKPGPH